MATVIERDDGKGKVFDVIFSWGKPQWKRTCPDKMSAAVMKKEVEAKIARLKQGSLTPPENLTKKELGEWLVNGKLKVPTVIGVNQPTLGDLIDGYKLSSLFQGKEPITQRVEKLKCKHLLRLLGEQTLLQDITEDMLETYVSTRKGEKRYDGKNVGAKTVKKELDVLRAIWNNYGMKKRLVKMDWRNSFPLGVDFGKMPGRVKRKTLSKATEADRVWFEQKDIAELLAHCKQRQLEVKDIYKWGYPAICYCCYTSFRRSTMITQEVGLVDFDECKLTGKIKKEDKSIEFTDRTIDMLEDLPSILKDWLANGHVGGKYLFGCVPDVMITDSQAWRCWKRYVKGTKFEKLKGQWHILRHSFVSICKANGVSKDAVRLFTGHHSVEVEQVYEHDVDNLALQLKGIFGSKA